MSRYELATSVPFTARGVVVTSYTGDGVLLPLIGSVF
jgi:hypothetical protein